MKAKKNIYILLPLTLIVWGIVAFRFWKITSDSIEPIQQKTIYDTTIPKQGIEKPTLLLNYNDPFLKRKRKKNKKVPKKIIPKKVEKVIWPKITYKGMVKSNSKKLIIITINNKQYVMGVGDENYGVKVVKILKEEFKLSYMNNERKFSFEK